MKLVLEILHDVHRVYLYLWSSTFKKYLLHFYHTSSILITKHSEFYWDYVTVDNLLLIEMLHFIFLPSLKPDINKKNHENKC